MPRPEITKLFADNLGALPHPDGTPRCLVQYRHFLQDDKAKLHFQKQAKDIGDCLQHLLEEHGYRITHEDDVKPADLDDYKTAHIKCACGRHLLDFNVSPEMNATLGGAAKKFLIAKLQTECPHHE